MDIVKGNMGWIEVVVGPMFSGKSEELIRRLRRAEIAKQRVQIFKPVIDQRYAKNGIVSHSGLELDSELVKDGADILTKVAPRTEVVGIDEAQFLGERMVESCVKLADMGKRVIVAGPGHRFHGPPVRADAAPAGGGRRNHQAAGHLHAMRKPCRAHAAPGGVRRTDHGRRRQMYEARCRRCFEPHLAQEKIEEEKAAAAAEKFPQAGCHQLARLQSAAADRSTQPTRARIYIHGRAKTQ